MRRPLATAALAAAALAATLLPALPAHACTAPRTPERPSGYCQNPRPVDQSPSPRPEPSECFLRMVTWMQPAYPAWGLDGNGKQGVDVFANHDTTVTLSGYERPSTDVRVLGTATTNEEGYANVPVRLQGHTRLFLSSDEPLCADRTQTTVALVQARLGALHAFRHGPRDYSFSTFYAGPAGKVGNLYRVLPDGREVLTSQTRLSGERVSIRRLFTGSGRFGFVLRTGDDVNSLGAATDVRPTVIH